ncbi:DEAD/DEAH box helicase [Limosilactobacillus sp.]|uniref:DEAD/DEAH box helicase n=1 Tax=Limosilactobacillus sp. TaxID=2773925 RepID=UPI0035A0E079
MKFNELGLSTSLLKAIKRSGYEEATPIQEQTIPMVLKGQDVIGQAQTGTGKTAAFGLPIIEHVDTKDPDIQAVVISPTRELAIQTQEELYRLGRDKRVRVQVVYGGADIRRQIRNLKQHPQILVGTPGRLRDHLRRHTVKLANIKTLVLDEADDMLNMGFLEDIEAIVNQTPKDRQTLLFSATMPPEIKKIGVRFMTNPKMVRIKAKELTTDLVDQYYVRAKDYEKFDIMTRLIDVQDPALTIVFGRTKRRVDELSKGLVARGYNAAGIHGDLSQEQRTKVMRRFKNGQLDILVATDVAARGLDISGVTHVYNYDIPSDPDSYVHRIGRTGRAGHHGVSLTFVTPNEMDYLHEIEKLTRVRMLPLKPPTAEEAFKGQVATAFNDIDDLVAQNSTDRYKDAAAKLLETHNAVDLVAALLNNMTKEAASEVPVKITPERPLPRRNRHHRRGNYHDGHNHYRRHDNHGRRRHGYHANNGHRSDNHGNSHSSRHAFNIRHRKED